ncbi:MAG: hypothetical protein ACI35P_15905 [Bacillus sp. (in: firmicutes)]
MSVKVWKGITIALLCLTGVGGLAGGVGFLVDPSGGSIGMPSSLLKGTMFSDFLIPGLLLFIVIGGGHILAGILVWKKGDSGWIYSFIAGVALVIWIFTQVCLIGYVSLLQPLYFIVGIVEVVLAFWLDVMRNRRASKVEKKD